MRGFRQFLETVLSAKIPAIGVRLFCIKQCACISVEAIEAFRRKNRGNRQEVKICNFFSDFLRYRDLNQIIIYTYCSRIKGSFE